MAKSRGVAGTLISGKTGALTWQVREGEQIVFESPVFDQKGVRTEAQAEHWERFAVSTSAAKAFEKQLKMSFEKQKRTDSFLSEFVKFNIKGLHVWLTREEIEGGMQVLDNYVVSHGSLDPDYEIKCGLKDNMVVSNIKLGDLQIGPDTTVKQFSNAVIANNGGLFLNHHRITFVRATQVPAIGKYKDSIRVLTYSLTLDQFDANGLGTKLSDVVGPDAFVSTLADNEIDGQSYYLSAPVKPETMLCWIHSFDLDGRTVCSDQFLIGSTTLQAARSTAEAQAKAIESYKVRTVNHLSPNSADSVAAQAGNGLKLGSLGHLPGDDAETPGDSTSGTTPGGGSGTGTGSDPTTPPASGGGDDDWSR